MTSSAILNRFALGMPWNTLDPFLFCVHHLDHYPKGNARLGPAPSLAGRNIGMDFELRDGWRMYHGEVVPGFPQHPHRGFETVTLVRRGLVDHADSLGATARYGHGDCQWMTAGKGIVHSEMFPLVDDTQDNPAELFQIWLNLPSANKMAAPAFKMLWNESIPHVDVEDESGKTTALTVVAGEYVGEHATARAPSPPPHSWAAAPANDVAIWTLRLQAGAHFELPPAKPGSNRVIFIFEGTGVDVDGETIADHCGLQLEPERAISLDAGDADVQILMLQGQPIGETVVQHGPFVMNSHEQIRQAFGDYQRTQFGGWPWPSDSPVHDREASRFAHHPDGTKDEPPKT